MAIRINFAGSSLLSPGSYSDVQVAESTVASPALGVVALIGEAEEGAAFADESGLDAATFGPDEFQAIVEKFGSGELVDAARLAISPSNDAAIRGGAQELILLKTNASSTAQLAIPSGASTYGTIKAMRAGLPGNNVSYACSIVDDKAIITLSRLDTGDTEVSEPIGGNAVMSIQCTDAAATAATVTITATHISTSVTGGSAAAINAELSRFGSVKQLCDFISAQSGYTASAASSAMGAKSVSTLDRVSALSIKTSAQIKKDAAEVREFFAKSAIAKLEPAQHAGLPTTKAKTFLAGGAKGGTSGAAIQDCLDALMKRRVNFVVPLFSRDAADDIADGLTDSSSSYSIDAVHMGVSAHCAQGATVKGRKERQGFVGFKGSYSETAEKAAALSSARVQLCMQDVKVLSASTGAVETKQPHMLAALSASMKASAPVGLPNTFKQPQIAGFEHDEFDPETQADKAIEDNICFVEKSPAGASRFKLDNSTYSQDKDAWVYNRPSVLYAADVAAYSIRLNTEQFIGSRNSDITEESIKNMLVGVMDQLKSAGIIVGDAKSGGRGYKDLSVRIKGSIAEIGVTLVLVEGLEFILSSIKVQRAG